VTLPAGSFDAQPEAEGELAIAAGDDVDQGTVPAWAAGDAHGQDFGLRDVKTGETAGALVDHRTTGHVTVRLLTLPAKPPADDYRSPSSDALIHDQLVMSSERDNTCAAASATPDSPKPDTVTISRKA
jgi:hypothetical protein